MANLALLVFYGIVMRVADNLEGERKYDSHEKNGQQSLSSFPIHTAAAPTPS